MLEWSVTKTHLDVLQCIFKRITVHIYIVFFLVKLESKKNEAFGALKLFHINVEQAIWFCSFNAAAVAAFRERFKWSN